MTQKTYTFFLREYPRESQPTTSKITSLSCASSRRPAYSFPKKPLTQPAPTTSFRSFQNPEKFHPNLTTYMSSGKLYPARTVHNKNNSLMEKLEENSYIPALVRKECFVVVSYSVLLFYYYWQPEPNHTSATKEKLEKYGWFWGNISRSQSEKKMTEEGKVGNFSIRINADGYYVMTLW